MRRQAWATRFGIYFAAIGSAFGLGSLWRFPYIVADNGGGAFVFLYLFLVVILGVPLLVGELLIGKVTRRGLLSGQRQLVAQAQSRGYVKKKFLIWIMPGIAVLSLMCATLILGYYSVVSGWVLYFLSQFVTVPFSDSPYIITQGMAHLRSSSGIQLGLTFTHLLIVCVVVAKGVEEGIERWVGFLVPLFILILAVLVFKSLSLPSSQEALRFFLYPDFSKLNISSLGNAIGHLCFTLSVGFATMITFGSYLRDDTVVPKTGFQVATLDSLSAVIGGFLIFPLLIGRGSGVRGPEMLFQTVPDFLYQLDGGTLFGIFFFICLYLAALGASISIMETLVANITENTKLTRHQATFLAGLVAGFCALVPAMSSSVFANVQLGGRGLLEIIDIVLINWVVPILAFLISQIVVYEVSPQLKRDEFMLMQAAEREILLTHWKVLMKWVAPPLILAGLLLQFIGLFL